MSLDLTDYKSSTLVQGIAWCRQWWAIAWANVDSDLCCHMAPIGHNGLIQCCISHVLHQVCHGIRDDMRLVLQDEFKWIHGFLFSAVCHKILALWQAFWMFGDRFMAWQYPSRYISLALSVWNCFYWTASSWCLSTCSRNFAIVQWRWHTKPQALYVYLVNDELLLRS